MRTNYKQVKDDVLDCYYDFLKLVQQTKTVNENDKSMVALAEQAKKIKEDRFTLMIAGEAKSGKSTFINAYLGKEILPMGVLQCTSSIVEIRYGKEFLLEATYADERKATVSGVKNIKAFLEENAAIDNNYRDIPVTLINNEIIVKFKDKKIPKEIIDDLLKGVERENIHKLPQEVYNEKIKKYLKEKQSCWRKVVIKIVITYPFEDKNMHGIRIIDSPGVNAVGRVGDITASYIETADAIMFLRPITGQAIEANSFKEFLESKSVDRNKNAIFLILTRSASENEATIEEAYQEFVKIFGSKNTGVSRGIIKEQIIPVDSKAEMYFNSFRNLTTEEIKKKIKELNAEQRADNFLKLAWYEADCEKKKFLDELKRVSRFENIDQALNKFGRKASFIALSEFLGRMDFVYNKAIKTIEENIGDWKIKQKDPKELARKLEEKKKELTDLENRLNDITDEISERYETNNGIIQNEADKAIEDYKCKIDKIQGNSDNSLDELEKLSFRQIDKFHDFQKCLQKMVIDECNKKLQVAIDKSAIDFEIIQPDFTKEMVDTIKTNLKAKAYVKESYEDGITFKTTKTRSVFSQQKYYDLVKNSIMDRINTIKGDVIRDLRRFVDELLVEYKIELQINIDDYRAKKEQIAKDKKKAEEIEETIAGLKLLSESMQRNLKGVRELKGGIDGNL